MNTKLIVLAIAATCGLAAQTYMTATIPFAFEFQGRTLAAGNYEVTRSSHPDMITVRNRTAGIAMLAMWTGTDGKPGAGNGLIFQKTGESYVFRSMVFQGSAKAYTVPATRKQAELARKQEPVPVFIAAR